MKTELDCQGLQCPEPVARCRSLIANGDHPELAVIVDNQPALENVSRFLARNGYETASSQIGPSLWRIDAAKSGMAQTPAPAPAATRETEAGKTVVLITSATLGRGDDELGAKLMTTFLASLSELGDSLWRVILLNGGVKLAATEGAPLDSLKALAASGVEVFVCGTCLMHYKLLEQKQVGETTNMMDILTSLALAQKVIRP